MDRVEEDGRQGSWRTTDGAQRSGAGAEEIDTGEGSAGGGSPSLARVLQ
jgi:hypothetical protein